MIICWYHVSLRPIKYSSTEEGLRSAQAHPMAAQAASPSPSANVRILLLLAPVVCSLLLRAFLLRREPSAERGETFLDPFEQQFELMSDKTGAEHDIH